MKGKSSISPQNTFGEARKRKDSSTKILGKGDSETDESSDSSHELEVDNGSQKIVEEQKRKWLNNSVESNAVPAGPKRKFGKELLAVGAGAMILAILWKYVSVDEHWMRSVPTESSKPPFEITITWDEGQKKVTEVVKKMEKLYPSQALQTWIQINAAVTSTMTKEIPRQPSCLVLLTPPNLDSGFTPCLAHQIGKATHAIFHNVTGLQFTQKIKRVSPADLQNGKSVTDIHDELKTYLNNGKVVVVHDVQQVNDPQRLMVFHAFCDNSAAPDKRATFIFILPVPPQVYRQYEWSYDNGAEVAQDILNKAWTSLSDDKRPALIARVCASIATINPGDRCSDHLGIV